MPTLTVPDEARPATASAPTALRLRLRRAGRPERTVEIEGAKCTIGSSPRCQVCLPAAEAQPLQCLLSLEAGAATVTRWAAGVLLNGREFTKHALRGGDRLSIGPWEIEWEADEPAVESVAAASATSAAERQTVDFTPPAIVQAPIAPLSPPKPAAPTAAPEPAPAVPTSLTVAVAPVEAAPVAHELVAPELAAPEPTPPAIRKSLAVTVPFESVTPPAPPSTPVQPRPAAKTVLVSSRQTDPFTDLLGPAKPATVADAPALPEAAPTRSFTSHAFEDRLVVSLWTANFVARTRAKALVAAARAARTLVVELTTAVTQIESQLLADRTTSGARAAESKVRLATLQGELTQALADRDRLTADLDALRNARPKTLPPDPRLKTLADAVAVAEREAAELREQLATNEKKIASLRDESAAAEAARMTAETERAAAEAKRAAAEAAQAAAETARTAAEAERTAAEAARAAADIKAEAARATAEMAGEQAESARAAAEAAQLTANGQFEEQQTALQQIADQRLAANQKKQQAEWDAERQAWELRSTIADQDAARLRDQLYACESQIEPLRAQVAEAETARVALTEQLATLEKQRSQWLAECRTLEQHRAAELADVVAERDELQRQLDDLASAPAAAILAPPASSAPTLVSPIWRSTFEDNAPAEAPESESSFDESPADEAQADEASFEYQAADESEVEDSPFTSRFGWDVETSQPTETFGAAADDSIEDAVDESLEEVIEETADESTDESTWAPAPALASWTPAEPADEEPADEEPPAPRSEPQSIVAAVIAPAAEPPAAPVSFIDKYRHLLEDDGEPEPSPRLSRPILDDEYLSPSKVELAASPDDDSDEALEAYMSNMMRRVRGDGAGATACVVSKPTVASAVRRATGAPTPADDPDAQAPAQAEPEIEVDSNGMLRLVRKPQASTNLNALRELANTSARSAIASHRQRRRLESALTKSVICAVALAASAYLILTAPDMHSPSFWGGCVTVLLAAGSGVQLLGLVWQRLTDKRRFAQPTKPAPMTAVADFSTLEPTIDIDPAAAEV